MGRIEPRLMRLEAQLARRTIERMAAEAGAPYGLTGDGVLEDAQEFFALSLPDQLAEVDRIRADLEAAGMTSADVEDLKASLVRDYRL